MTASPDAPAAPGLTPAQAQGLPLIDVRRAPAFAASDVMIAGAWRHDPAEVDTWAEACPRDAALVVYCVHGHEVSQQTAARLRAAGVDAHFLVGGLERWRAEGRPLRYQPPA